MVYFTLFFNIMYQIGGEKMLCEGCLDKFVDKLLQEDIKVLEYLEKSNAAIPQCSISRSKIKEETKLSVYKCYTSLDRLECLDMVGQQSRSKSNKYFITNSGKYALASIDKKMMG